jgi:hypothetical protein
LACLVSPAFAEESPTFKFNALAQMWMTSDSTGGIIPATNFKPRRAELKFTGSVTPEWRWIVMADVAKTLSASTTSGDNKVLSDIAVYYKPADWVEFGLGQVKILTVAESTESSGALLFPERSMSGRTFGEKRQAGLNMWFKMDPVKLGLMVSNGGTTNRDDNNTAKDITGRAEVAINPRLSAGAFFWAQEGSFGDFGKYGGNLKWAGDLETLKVEFAQGNDASSGSIVTTQGFMAEGAYKITDRWMPALRYEFLKTDLSSGVMGTAVSIGLNYLADGNKAKVQLAYAFLTNVSGGIGSYVFSSNGNTTERLLTLAAQISI